MSSKLLQRIFSVLLVAGMLLSFVQPSKVSASQVEAPKPPVDALAKIETLVLDQISESGSTDFFVWMTEKADLSPAAKLATKLEKGTFVYNTLTETATRTQKGVIEALRKAHVDYTSFYISNKVLVKAGNYDMALALASRTDVAKITANHPYQLDKPYIMPDEVTVTNAIEPNVTFIKAPDVWAMGITGQGTVLAGNDTGLQWDHPAIIDHYRGWNGSTADHNYNWWDATGDSPSVPYDGYGHGTHTTGTMVGDDGGSNQIGVAPGAQTIHCRNMDSGGSGDDYTFSTCFQWDLAPWDLNGNNPEPSMAPDAVNNSWGYWGGNAPQFEDEIAALQAAGTLVEVSAGNEGPYCSTLRSPADYDEVLTTGSINHAGGVLPGTLTDFSSRGPSYLYPDGYFPDIMAPGENIRSSVPGSTYQGGWSGTSMAGPHATALVGLMWSANPALQGQVGLTIDIIHQTAVPLTGVTGSSCGGDYTTGPNNDWGYGTIDALAAVQAAILYGGAGTLAGTVTEGTVMSAEGDPIEGALVEADLNDAMGWSTKTDENGEYSMMVLSGTYTVTVSAFGYIPQTFFDVLVEEDGTTDLSPELIPAESYMVSGVVSDANTGWPLYASIAISGGGYPGGPIWTDPVSGYYEVMLPEGVEFTFDVEAWLPGYNPANTVFGPLSHDLTLDFPLDVDVAACEAPGYTYNSPLNDDFDPGGFADLPWTVVNNGGTCVWADDDPNSRGNSTGGSGRFAIADSDYCGSSGYMNTELRTPAFDASAWPTLILEFKDYYYYSYTGGDVRQVDVWNGSSWVTVWGYTGGGTMGPETIDLDITAAANGAPDAMVRFYYYNAYWEYWWEVDDVKIIGNCVPPTDGGLVVGNVYDNNTMLPLVGADVVNDDGGYFETVATPDDPNVDDGFYTLYSSTAGDHDYQASEDNYAPDDETVAVPYFDAVRQDFYLGAGWLNADPNSLAVTLEMGESTSLPLDLNNIGGLPASFEIGEQDKGFDPALLNASAYVPPASSGMGTNLMQFANSDASGSRALSSSPDQDILLDQQPNLVNGIFSDSGCDLCTYGQQSIAENFSLPDGASIGQIVFWTGYFPGDVPLDTDTITVIFHEDLGGYPGAAIYTESDVEYAREQTGVILFGVHEWIHTLTLGSPVALEPGNYWVEIYNDTGFGTDDFFWETGDPDTIGNGLVGQAYAFETPGSSWYYDSTTEMAIQLLTGSAADVPWLSEEPITGTIPADTLDTQLITVTFDASVPEVVFPGDYMADLVIDNDTPYGKLSVPVTMTVLPPTDWGKVEGYVTDNCTGEPVKDAEIFFQDGYPITTTYTDEDGYYWAWLQEGMLFTTFSADGYLPSSMDITIVSGETVEQDVILIPNRPCIETSTDFMEVWVLTDTAVYTEINGIDLTNNGGMDNAYEITEKDGGYTTTVSIPRSDGNFPRGDAVPSFGPAPITASGAPAPATIKLPNGTTAYSIEAVNSYFTAFDLEAPDNLPNLGPYTTLSFPNSGAYVNDSVYVIDGTTLLQLDPADGSVIDSMPITPPGGSQDYVDMALDPTTGDVYATSCDISSSILWMVDLETGTATQIGTIPDMPCAIGMAIDGTGQMWAYDLVVDSFYAIDKDTGADTYIGSIGFDANYGQGMGWNQEDGNLYMAAFNNSTFQAELRLVDPGTGNTTLLGVLGSSYPGFAQVPFLTVPIIIGNPDVPWIWEDPVTGTIPATSTINVDVMFSAQYTDTTPMPLGTYTATLSIKNEDTVAGTQKVTAVMHIVEEYITPIAGFEAETPGCDGVPMVFTNTTVAGVPWVSDFTWDFGDGTVSNEETPTHVFPGPGTYTVSLEACNLQGYEIFCTTATADVEVKEQVDAAFDVMQNGLTVAFTNATVGADEYLWDFGDGITSTETSPEHAYAASGMYTVTLMATGFCGVDEEMMVLDVVATADLAVSKAADADMVVPGGTLNYTLVVDNMGPDTAHNVVLVDTLPDGVTFVSAEGCTEDMGVVTCDVGDLESGASVTFMIEVTAPDTLGTITNVATVTGDEFDPDETNNEATLDTMVTYYRYYLPLNFKHQP